MLQNHPRSLMVATLLLGQLTLGGACAVSKQRGSLGVDTGAGASDCCRQPQPAEGTSATPGITIPDIELLDQDGRAVRFYTDFVKGKTVLISFFFTSCTTVCPTLTAIMSQVQRELLLEGRNDVQLISLSVDPVRDTPPRLKTWSRNFSARPGWVFLTGQKSRVDRLLKALRTFTPDPQDHTPMVLIGNEPRGIWKQVSGLSSAGAIANAVRALAGEPSKSEVESATQAMPAHGASSSSPDPGRKSDESAHRYFGDVELQDQNGTTHRLYTDLMQGHVMLVNSFFSTCTGVCPVMAQKIKDIRAAFSDRVGKDFVVLSISVDPEVDTPTRLNEYAKNLRAGSGWYFLTGTTENIEIALHKFGLNADGRENHSNLFLLGNDLTSSWKKVFSLAPTEELLPLVADVFNARLPFSASNPASDR